MFRLDVNSIVDAPNQKFLWAVFEKWNEICSREKLVRTLTVRGTRRSDLVATNGTQFSKVQLQSRITRLSSIFVSFFVLRVRLQSFETRPRSRIRIPVAFHDFSSRRVRFESLDSSSVFLALRLPTLFFPRKLRGTSKRYYEELCKFIRTVDDGGGGGCRP